MKHPFQINDILVAQWGATMRMVDFYKVLRVTKRTVILGRLAQDETPTGFLCGTTVPNPDKLESMPPLHRLDPTFRRYPERAPSGDWFDTGHNSSTVAIKWDGSPVAYDHCD